MSWVQHRLHGVAARLACSLNGAGGNAGARKRFRILEEAHRARHESGPALDWEKSRPPAS